MTNVSMTLNLSTLLLPKVMKWREQRVDGDSGTQSDDAASEVIAQLQEEEAEEQ